MSSIPIIVIAFLLSTISNALTYVPVPLSFADARKYCKTNYGTDLAPIGTEQDADDAISLIEDDYQAWVGLYTRSKCGQWRYVNSDPCSFDDTVYKCVDIWSYRLNENTKYRPRCISNDGSGEEGYQCAYFDATNEAAPVDCDPPKLSKKGIARLKADEGYETEVYEDTEGHETAGWGHKLTEAEKQQYPLGSKVPEETLLEWFEEDLKTAEEGARDVVEATEEGLWCELSEARRDVLINMAYNLGKTGLSGFMKMLAALKDGDYEKAAEEMKDSKWYNQVTNRAERLIKIMKKGEYDAKRTGVDNNSDCEEIKPSICK